MLKRFCPPLAWSVSLLLASLWLAACSGAPGATSPSEATTPPQTAEATATSVEVPETATSQATTPSDQGAAEETPATAIAAASPAANSTTAPKQASCQAIEIPINERAAEVSDAEWSKGPANAPVTLIEYADFQ